MNDPRNVDSVRRLFIENVGISFERESMALSHPPCSFDHITMTPALVPMHPLPALNPHRTLDLHPPHNLPPVHSLSMAAAAVPG